MNKLSPTSNLSLQEQLFYAVEDGGFLERITAVPDDLKHKTEMELEELFKGGCPTRTDRAVKQRLWNVFYDIQKAGFNQKINGPMIYNGICSRQGWQYFMERPHKLAWLIVPPLDHETMIKEAALYSLERLRNDVLTMPVNEKTAPIIFKVAQYFIDRFYGPVEQVIRQNTTQVNVDGNKMMRDVADENGSLLDKYKELQNRISSAQKVIDVQEPE